MGVFYICVAVAGATPVLRCAATNRNLETGQVGRIADLRCVDIERPGCGLCAFTIVGPTGALGPELPFVPNTSNGSSQPKADMIILHVGAGCYGCVCHAVNMSQREHQA